MARRLASLAMAVPRLTLGATDRPRTLSSVALPVGLEEEDDEWDDDEDEEIGQVTASADSTAAQADEDEEELREAWAEGEGRWQEMEEAATKACLLRLADPIPASALHNLSQSAAARAGRAASTFARYQTLLAHVRRYFAAVQSASHSLLLRTANLKQLQLTLDPLTSLLALPPADLQLYSAVAVTRKGTTAATAPPPPDAQCLEAAKRVYTRLHQISMLAAPLLGMAAVKTRRTELQTMVDGWTLHAQRSLSRCAPEMRGQWLVWMKGAAPARHDALFTAYLADEAAPRHRQRIRELLHQVRGMAEGGEETRLGHISGKEQALRGREKAWLARLQGRKGDKGEKEEKLRNDEAFNVLLSAGALWAAEETAALTSQWGASQTLTYLNDMLIAPLRQALQHVLGSFSAQNHLYLLPVVTSCAAHEKEPEPIKALAKEMRRAAEALLAQLQEAELSRLSSASASVSGFPRYVDLCLRLRPPAAALKAALTRLVSALLGVCTTGGPTLPRLLRAWSVRSLAAELQDSDGLVKEVFAPAEAHCTSLADTYAASLLSEMPSLRFLETLENLARTRPIEELQFQSSHSRANTQAFVASLTAAELSRKLSEVHRVAVRHLPDASLLARVWAALGAHLSAKIQKWEELLQKGYHHGLMVSAADVPRICREAETHR